MFLKKAVKYRYKTRLMLFVTYYVMIAMLFIGKTIATRLYKYETGGFEHFIGSAILLFIVGIMSYYPDLKVFIQNGISREKAFISFLLYLPVIMVNAILDSVIFFIQMSAFGKDAGKEFGFAIDNLTTSGIQTYASFVDPNVIYGYLGMLLTIVSIYLAAITFGYMIAAITMRLKALGRTIFFIIIGLVPFMSLYAVNNQDIYNDIFIRFIYCLFLYGNEYLTSSSFAMIAISFLCIAWLVSRKMPVRK